MLGKKNNKNVTKIIVALITGIALIVVACIETKQDFLMGRSEKEDFEMKDNSGVAFTGDNFGEVSIVNNQKETDQEKEEKVTLTGKMHEYVSGGVVEDEFVNMYSDEGYEPVCDFQVLNENEITIDIENVFIEVLDYKDFSEFIVEYPRGGASLLEIIYWRVNINPELKKYSAILTGAEENNPNDVSDTEYVSIKASDSGKFKLKIFPDTPGMYEGRIIVEYTSYGGGIKEIKSKNVKFIYDPNHEANIM